MINAREEIKGVSWLDQAHLLKTPKHIKVTFTGCSYHEPLKANRPRQVHGKDIISAKLNSHDVEADGIFTSDINEPIAVRTADCLPLLLFSQNRDFILAVHAGWKGFVKGILETSTQISKLHDVLPSDLKLIIGPTIGPQAFEVGPEVVTEFKSILDDGQQALVISKGINDRWHIDLQLAAVSQFVKMGISPDSIQVLRICTKSNLNYHSYRREGPGCGHNYSVIERISL